MPRHALFTEGSSGGKHRLVDETVSGGQHAFFATVGVAASDDFNRSDSTSLDVTSVGALPWIPLNGEMGISSNQAYPATFATGTHWGDVIEVIETGGANGDITVTMSTVQPSGGPLVVFRAVDADRYLVWAAAVGFLEFLGPPGPGMVNNRNSGAHTQPANGDVIRINLDDDTVTLFVNGTQTMQVTGWSTHQTATQHGIGSASNVTTNRLDDFSFVPA